MSSRTQQTLQQAIARHRSKMSTWAQYVLIGVTRALGPPDDPLSPMGRAASHKAGLRAIELGDEVAAAVGQELGDVTTPAQYWTYRHALTRRYVDRVIAEARSLLDQEQQ